MKLTAVALFCLAGCTRLLWYGHSPDRSVAINVEEQLWSQRVVIDGKPGPWGSGVGIDGLAFDGQHALAYPIQRSGGWQVVFREVVGPRFEAIGALVLSDNGQHLAYAAMQGGRWWVLTDDAQGPRVDAVLSGSLLISNAGKSAYAATRGEDSYVIVDGVVEGPFSGVSQLRANGEHFAFLARRHDDIFLHEDSRETAGPFQQARIHSVAPTVVSAQLPDGQWHLIRHGAQGAGFDLIAGVVLENEHVAYRGRRGDSWFVVSDDNEHGAYRDIGLGPMLTERGVIFVARESEAWVTRTPDGEYPLDGVTALESLVVKGSRWAVTGSTTGQHYLLTLDGETQQWDWVGSVTFSDDARRVAFLGQRGAQNQFVVDGQAHPIDVMIADTIAFSREGRRAATFAGLRASRQLIIAFDDGARREVNLEELVAQASLVGSKLTQAQWMRRWVAAELER